MQLEALTLHVRQLASQVEQVAASGGRNEPSAQMEMQRPPCSVHPGGQPVQSELVPPEQLEQLASHVAHELFTVPNLPTGHSATQLPVSNKGREEVGSQAVHEVERASLHW